MEPVTWTPTGGGTSNTSSAAPDLTTLSSAGSGFEQFDASSPPAGRTLELVAATTSAFALYIEATTSAGRRQFKLEPGAAGAELRFGYRYQVGLGDDARDGTTQTTVHDLDAIVRSVEPGVEIGELTAMFVRLAGSMDIGFATGTVEPPPNTELTATDAVRLLQQASFGPTPAEHAAVARGSRRASARPAHNGATREL